MKELSEKELKKINGGGISIGVALASVFGLSFFVGVLDGITRPFKCR